MKRLALLFPLLLAGCQLLPGNTRVESVHSERPSAATLQKVLVLGISVTDELQAALEKSFVRELGGKDRQIIPSSQWYADGRLPPREQVEARVRAEGVTAVLVMRLENYQEVPVQEPRVVLFTPPRTAETRVGWAAEPWTGAMEAQQLRERAPLVERRVTVVTRLYDTASQQLVWEAHTQTVLGGDSVKRDAAGFAAAIVRQLRENGWL